MTENRTFNQIFPDSNSFTAGLPQEYLEYMQDLNGNNIVPMGILYLLLKGKYGLSRIAGSSEDSFKNRLYALIFQYGPTWARNMQIQDKLRKLTDAQLLTGSKQVNDHAYNPSTVIEGGPNPDSGEIETTNEQTRTKYTKSYMEAYYNLMSLLKRDVTEDFLNRFKSLFQWVISFPCDCEGDEEAGE